MAQEDDQIPLNILQGMPPDQINILLVQGFNSQVRELKSVKHHVQAYSDLLEKKIGRDEFTLFKDEVKGKLDNHRSRLEEIEGEHQDGDVRKKFAFSLGKYFWITVLAIMNLLQFFYAIGEQSSNQ